MATIFNSITLNGVKYYLNSAGPSQEQIDDYFEAHPEAAGQVSSVNGETGDVMVQELLTFDDTPTSGSDNPVKSGGVYSALQGSTPSAGGWTDVTTAMAFNVRSSSWTASDNYISRCQLASSLLLYNQSLKLAFFSLHVKVEIKSSYSTSSNCEAGFIVDSSKYPPAAIEKVDIYNSGGYGSVSSSCVPQEGTYIEGSAGAVIYTSSNNDSLCVSVDMSPFDSGGKYDLYISGYYLCNGPSTT